MGQTRNVQRESFSDHDRIVLTEQDLDQFDSLAQRLDRLTWAAFLLLVSITSATVVAALQFGV